MPREHVMGLTQPVSYAERQTARDSEYQRAWDNAPVRFKKAAAKMGLQCETEQREGMAIAYEENYIQSSYRPNMEDLVDNYVDYVIEEFAHDQRWSRFANELPELVRAIAKMLKKPMEQEIVQNRSFLLARVACYLIKEEGPKILPRVHALLHSIPGLAKQAGYGSLRISAEKCRVSAEWLRRRRDKWCYVLSIPVPTESRKSNEARAKYKTNALVNHWRSQRYHTNGNNGNNGTNGIGNNGHTGVRC